MSWLLIIVLALLALAVVSIKLKSPATNAESYPYAKVQALFSPAERSFLGVLDQAVGNEYRIFGKVRIADVVEPKRGMNNSNRQKALNRVTSKHFDFVLCAKSDLSIVCAIELDDQSHQQRKRQERDAFLAGLCQAISLPLVRVPAQRAYSVAEIRTKLLSEMGERQIPVSDRTGSATAAPSKVIPLTNQNAGQLEAESKDVAPACPKCGSPMIHRQAQAGSMAGQWFWGCSTFPKCRGVIQGAHKRSLEPAEQCTAALDAPSQAESVPAAIK